jgi:hypothetical protein
MIAPAVNMADTPGCKCAGRNAANIPPYVKIVRDFVEGLRRDDTYSGDERSALHFNVDPLQSEQSGNHAAKWHPWELNFWADNCCDNAVTTMNRFREE